MKLIISCLIKLVKYNTRMKHKSFAHMNCSIAQTLEIIGERWTLLILRDAFRGVSRFEDFVQTGMSRNVLTERLKNLVEHEILEKRPVDGKSSEYLLTVKGVHLQPVLLSITHWGDKYMANPKGTRTIFIERDTGKPIAPMSPYSADGRALKPTDIGIKAGPGSSLG